MDDQDYVAELVAILTNKDPQGIDPDDPYGQADDGIDRYDGYGRDFWVESLRVCEGPNGAELEVTFGLAVPTDPEFATWPSQGTFSVPFDSAWRQLSGYGEPAAYAPRVASRTQRAVGNLADRYRAGRDWFADRQRVLDQLPARPDQWRMLLEELAAEGRISEPSPGRITVDIPSGDAPGRGGGQVTVLVTPDQWKEILINRGGGYGDFWETFGSRLRDEVYLVFDDGDLVMSVREELPPVRGSADFREVAQRIAEIRAKDPDAKFSLRLE